MMCVGASLIMAACKTDGVWVVSRQGCAIIISHRAWMTQPSHLPSSRGVNPTTFKLAISLELNTFPRTDLSGHRQIMAFPAAAGKTGVRPLKEKPQRV